MAIRTILQYPSPALRRISEPAAGPSRELFSLIADLCETLESLPGCTGIAAPQVGETVRLVVVDASRYRKPVGNHGRLVLINPVQRVATGRDVFREGCLSLPDYTANVPRATEVEYEALDRALEPVTIRASGFEAVVIQHECDHLDGILFIDRVVSLKTDVFRRKKYL